MDGSLVIIEGSLLSISLLLKWMVALSLWKVVCRGVLCHSNGWEAFRYGGCCGVDVFVIWMDGSLLIMEGSVLLIFLLFEWMLALSSWKVVSCGNFCYSNGWYPCHYGRYSIVDIFDTTMDCSLVVMEGSLLSISLLLQWMVALSL